MVPSSSLTGKTARDQLSFKRFIDYTAIFPLELGTPFVVFKQSL